MYIKIILKDDDEEHVFVLVAYLWTLLYQAVQRSEWKAKSRLFDRHNGSGPSTG
jgi:hypothetical protein